MKSNKYLGLAIMGMMMSFPLRENESKLKEFQPPQEPKKVIPRGCKEYHFTKGGNIVGENCTYIVYSCIASSEKKAREKFSRYILKT